MGKTTGTRWLGPSVRPSTNHPWKPGWGDGRPEFSQVPNAFGNLLSVRPDMALFPLSGLQSKLDSPLAENPVITFFSETGDSATFHPIPIRNTAESCEYAHF